MVLDDSLAASARAEGVERLVVGAVIHRDGAVLVVRRSADDAFLPGIDEVPSGGVEAGEALRDALDRELLEEVGFTPEAIDDAFLHTFDYISGSGRRARQFTVSVPLLGNDVRLSDEHSDCRWIRACEISSTTCTPETRGLLAAWFAN